jgi:hypothetical protein
MASKGIEGGLRMRWRGWEKKMEREREREWESEGVSSIRGDR